MTDYGETVAKGTIEVSYIIRQFGEQFDWVAADGDDSDELYESLDEARSALFNRYGV